MFVLRALIVFGVLLGTEVGAAQSETTIARAAGREARCSVGRWELSAPEIISPGEPLWVRFEGPADPMPTTIAITMRGPSGIARRTAVYEPNDREEPICDSVGPRPCGPRGTRRESFGVLFDARSIAREGDHRLEAGSPGQRPACRLTVHVSRALARVQRMHAPAQNTALFARSHRTSSWQLVRAPLAGARSYEHARAVIGESTNAIEVDVIAAVDAAELAAYFGSMRLASFEGLADTDDEDDEDDEVRPARPDDPREVPLLPSVFYSEALLHVSVSTEGFEIAWQVSAALIPASPAIVRIRGRELGAAEREIVAAYLGALHPSLPPALP